MEPHPLVWLFQLSPEIWAAVIGAVAAVAVGALAALVVVWQIGVQARLAISQQRDNEALRLKLQIYLEAVRFLEAASDANSSYTSYIRNFQMQLRTAIGMVAAGQRPPIPNSRVPQSLDLKNKVQEKAVEVIYLTERWRIIEPKMDLFAAAISSALHEVRELFPTEVDDWPLYPMEDPTTGELRPWNPPSEERFELFDRNAEKMLNVVTTLDAYVSDMMGQLQNLLLGELFPNQLPVRRPIDPAFVALDLTRYNELMRHFSENTDWGRKSARVIAESTAQYGQENRGGELREGV